MLKLQQFKLDYAMQCGGISDKVLRNDAAEMLIRLYYSHIEKECWEWVARGRVGESVFWITNN